jgi:hydroxymethylglutaryl-CoA lyase
METPPCGESVANSRCPHRFHLSTDRSNAQSSTGFETGWGKSQRSTAPFDHPDPAEFVSQPGLACAQRVACRMTLSGFSDVEIVDVGPRDGLQNDPVILPTPTKVELVSRLIDAGMKRIEVTSFVNPARVPAMADAAELMALLPRHKDVSYVGLVLNEKGLERAVAANVDEVNCVTMTSDSFSQRNQGVDALESVAVWGRIAAAAAAAQMPASVIISAAFGCPFEGEVATSRLLEIVERSLQAAFDGGCQPVRLVLADTIGAAAPGMVIERCEAVRVLTEAADVPLGCHFHDTRNTGVANAWAAVSAGVVMLEASIGGIGGCPFAPNATGNVATEDIVFALERSGLSTGLDLAKLRATTQWLGEQLGRRLPSGYSAAGPVPTGTQA